MIRFSCPACKNVNEVSADKAGTKMPCSRCGQRLLVPRATSDLERTMEGNLVAAGAARGGKSSSSGRSSDKATSWYYVRNGQRLGPVPATQLGQLFSAGQVRPADLVWTEGMASWQPAKSVSERFAPEPEIVSAVPSSRPGTVSHSTILNSARMRPVKFKFLLLGGMTGAIASLLTVVVLLLWRGKPVAVTQTGPDREPTVEELVERCKPSVARIDYPVAGGSGFFVDDNLMVTNSHVIDLAPAKELKILFPSAEGGKVPLTGELLYENPTRDLAILRVAAKVKPLEVAESFQVKGGGQKILIIGSPGATAGETITLENAVTPGHMSTEAVIDKLPWYQLSAAVNPGNSGGPVFDAQGRVIGVVTRKAVGSRQEGMGFAIPVADLRSALNAARTVSKADADKLTALHDRRALYRRLDIHGRQYIVLMDQMRKLALEEIRDGTPVVAAYARARNELKKRMTALADSRQGLAPHVPGILDNPELKAEARQRFQELLRTHEEMAEHLEQPGKAGYENFNTRLGELAVRHFKLMDDLKPHLELAPLE